MKIKWYNTIDSTFSAMERSRGELSHLEVWAARFQSAGVGQRGNVWSSREGENLTFSIYLRHNGFPAADQFLACQAISLGICNYLGGKGVEARIKWPNDIYVGDRKICGVLIRHSVAAATLTDSVVGIGLNINQDSFPQWIPNPTSLFLETGRRYEPEEELQPLLDCILGEYDSIPHRTAGRYMDRLYLKDISHSFSDAAGNRFDGIIRGVKTDGRLEVETAAGFRYFAFKEIAY